jgi:hypothetical protein
MKYLRLPLTFAAVAIAWLAGSILVACSVRAPVPGTPVAGATGGGWPRASAESEGISTVDWRQAMQQAQAAAPDVLLVARHGHLLAEIYGHDAEDSRLLPGGLLSDCLAWLAAGAAIGMDRLDVPAALAAPQQPCAGAAGLPADISRGAAMPYAAYLSRAIWQPLRAAAGTWDGNRMHARALDWLRVGQLLLADGAYEGTRVVPTGWVQRMLAPGTGGVPRPDPLQLQLGDGAYMWLSPRRALVVLEYAGAADAGLHAAEAVMRTVHAPGAATGSLGELVPGH